MGHVHASRQGLAALLLGVIELHMKYTLERPRSNQCPTEKIINELRRVADLYGHRHFSRHEFDEKTTACKGSTVLSRFGSWQGALEAADLKLERVKQDHPRISNDELFAELDRVWYLLARLSGFEGCGYRKYL
jgi:hypothetical protein